MSRGVQRRSGNNPGLSAGRLVHLDALRGVVAFVVVWYHCYEGFTTDIATQVCAHGFLAVDFFFLLSGFVTGYAYDQRWASTNPKRLNLKQFFLRRLIRLHPMVVAGVLLGLVSFVVGGCVGWFGQHADVMTILALALMSLLLIPSLPGSPTEVRGFGECFPLNGPHWSMFFEYLGNVLYALALRKLRTRTLSLFVALNAGLYVFIVCLFGRCDFGWGFIQYDLAGTSIQLSGFYFGLIRLLFPYSAGLLLSRLFQGDKFVVRQVDKHGSLIFLLSAIALVILLGMPYLNTSTCTYYEPVYLIVCNLMVFPVIVWLGACAGTSIENRVVRPLASFLGDISYPLYAIHYPALYLLFQYIGFPNATLTMDDVWMWAVLIVVCDVAVAYLLMRFYDAPVRRWLSGKLSKK